MPVKSQGLCGYAISNIDGIELRVVLSDFPERGWQNTVEKPYVTLKTTASENYRSIQYSAVREVLGQPSGFAFATIVPLSKSGVPESFRLDMREGSDPWIAYPGWHLTFPGPDPAFGSVQVHLKPRNYPSELDDVFVGLKAAKKFDFRFRNQQGDIVANGTVAFPATNNLSSLYSKTYQQAVKRLAACGPPIIVKQVEPPKLP